MPRFPTLLILAVGLVSTGCAGSPSETTARDTDVGPPSGNQGIIAGTLEAKAVRPVITLRNTTEHVVGYMVVDKDQALMALYPPCGQQCPQLVQGGSATVTYTQISGYTQKSTEALVLWWTYRRAADGTLQPEGAMQTTRVRL
jgi:hypothetical protein